MTIICGEAALVALKDIVVTGWHWRIAGIRILAIIVGLVLWHVTQSLLGRRGPGCDGALGDAIHNLTAPLHRYLVAHPRVADRLLITSSFLIDLLGVFLLLSAIFGPSIRPFLGLLMLFGLRQLCQGLCTLPPPPGMIWRDPGFPSLLVTYGVSNDLFFSGHTALAVYGALTLGEMGGWYLAVLGLLIGAFEIGTVLILRAHYTLDVFTGAITALWVAGVANWLAPFCDRAIARIV